MRDETRGRLKLYKPPRETLVVTFSQLNSEALTTCVVLAHPCAAFHPYTCGLREGAAALVRYDHVKVVIRTTTRR
jgi:hypothetical protein